MWIPKEENSKEIDQFRIISLLNIEGKIFFSILSRCLSKFLITNEYVDTSVQKGDLANAYGSIPHKVVEATLPRYHVPSFVNNLILDYYNNFNLRVTSGTKTLDWHRLDRRIITGCTISATLFSFAMNMIIKSGDVECWGPMAKSGIRQNIHGRYYSDNIICHSLQVDCKGLRKTHSMALHEV